MNILRQNYVSSLGHAYTSTYVCGRMREEEGPYFSELAYPFLPSASQCISSQAFSLTQKTISTALKTILLVVWHY